MGHGRTRTHLHAPHEFPLRGQNGDARAPLALGRQGETPARGVRRKFYWRIEVERDLRTRFSADHGRTAPSSFSCPPLYGVAVSRRDNVSHDWEIRSQTRGRAV